MPAGCGARPGERACPCNPALQAIVGADLTGAVIDATVLRVDADGDAQLAVGSGTLRRSVRGATAGSRVRLQVLARDVILALQPLTGVSVRNALAGTVRSIASDAHGVLVSVDVGGATVLARITPAALRALALPPAPPCGRCSRPSRRAATPSAWPPARRRGPASRSPS